MVSEYKSIEFHPLKNNFRIFFKSFNFACVLKMKTDFLFHFASMNLVQYSGKTNLFACRLFIIRFKIFYFLLECFSIKKFVSLAP